MVKFSINLFLVLYDPNLNPQFDKNINSPLIAHIRLINVVFRIQKFKKEKWLCSHNFDLNPTCETRNYRQKEKNPSKCTMQPCF